MSDFEASLLGIRVGGKYVVDRILGRGGMGCVALGHHDELGQKVAIKFMLADVAKDASLVARFSREAQLAAKLQSEHVVRVFDVGRLDRGLPYLVMEYLEGTSLAEVMTSVPLETAVDYVLQALEALAEAHALGVVHRDLKPENLFLARKMGKGPMVKVLDFGISKSVDVEPSKNALTQTSSMLGSPMYMSPEQIRDSKTVDTRSDIWSMGVVLYELAERRAPFDGASVGELLGRIQYESPAPMTASAPAFSAVVMKCLARSPSDRYRSVAELARALAPFGTAAAASSLAMIEQHAAPPLPETDLAYRNTMASAPEATTRNERRPAPAEDASWSSTRRSDPTPPAAVTEKRGLARAFVAISVLLAGVGVAAIFAARARTAEVSPPPRPAVTMSEQPSAPAAELPAPAATPTTVLLPVVSAAPPAPRAVASAAKKPAAAPAASSAPTLAEPDRGF